MTRSRRHRRLIIRLKLATTDIQNEAQLGKYINTTLLNMTTQNLLRSQIQRESLDMSQIDFSI
jgi:hypothetical protein